MFKSERRGTRTESIVRVQWWADKLSIRAAGRRTWSVKAGRNEREEWPNEDSGVGK